MNLRVIENLKTNFPFLAADAVDYIEHSDCEVVVKLEDGRMFLYDDMDKSFRKLPSNCYELSEDECRSEFGQRLYKIMFRKGFTQFDLSEKTGIQQSLLSNYITGKRSPSFYNVDRIAKALGCSVDEFRYLDK